MRVGFYESDITPPLGGDMPGYYGPDPAKDVYERLYAKACVIEENGTYAAIVALDTCEYVDEMTKVVTDRVFEYTGIPAESICIHVVHTHKGAPVEDARWTGQGIDLVYREVYYRLAADAIILAYRRMVPAVAKFGQGHVTGWAFCRNYVLKDGRVRTFGVGDGELDHMLAEIDPALPIMVFENEEGEKIGALLSYACHQDCTGVDGYSSDYGGVIGKELKKVYGQDFVTVFMIGTAGDINHVRNDPSLPWPDRFYYRRMGAAIAEVAAEVIEKAEPVGDGVAVIKEDITLERRQTTPAETARQVEKWAKVGSLMRIRNILYYGATNKETHSTMPLQIIRVGNTAIYVMPGEIYVNFGREIKERSKFENNFVIENSNAFGGYIPTPEAFGENCDLYETSLCYGSRHVPEAGGMMVEQLLRMAEKI